MKQLMVKTAGLLLFLSLSSCAASQQSEALKRFKTKHKSHWSNTLPTEASIDIKYSNVTGIGFEDSVIRRDPTDIIKVGDTYFLWYTHSKGGPLSVGFTKANDTLRAYPWDLSEIWLATSTDGINWVEQGVAVTRGPEGNYDARSVFTPNILAANNKYYLFYQTAPGLADGEEGDFKWTKFGMSWADSPFGPWHRAEKPVLEPGNYGNPGNYPNGPIVAKGDWDGLIAHDPSCIAIKGKYYLYYKSRYFRGSDERFSSGDLKDWVEKEGGIPIGWGVAVADKPEGPYVKSAYNPVIIGGHECIVWPHKGGVCALIAQGPECNTVQFSTDGINFKVIGTVKEAPIAAGIYRPDATDGNVGDTDNHIWGISHVVQQTPWHFLRRFDFTEELCK